MKTLQAWALQYKSFLVILLLLNGVLGLAIIAQSYAIVQIVDSVFIQSTTFQQVIPYLWDLPSSY